MAKNINYKEPDDFFPDELLKKYKLGKYNDEFKDEDQEKQRANDNKELRSVFKGK